MNRTEKAILYISSYFILFIIAITLQTVKDLPASIDVVIFMACIYMIAVRNEILAHHIMGEQIVYNGGKLVVFGSAILRILIGLIIVKLMILGFFQYILIVYVVDYFTWIKAGRSLSQVLSLYSIGKEKYEG